MSGERNFIEVMIRRGVQGIVAALVMWLAARFLFHFPPVFQVMFVLYAFLGTGVFILLDAPSLSPISGFKAVALLVGFYAVISLVYIAGASALPQYDPMVEKGKIEKIVKPKLAATEKGKNDELLKRTEALNAESQAILKRLEALGGEEAKKIEASVGGGSTGGRAAPAAAGGDLVALGKEQYDLQECYNCHKIGGKGSVKKRGPVLDNIGNLMKPEEIKEKLMSPRAWMAEGFEKEYNKKLMPDKYKELMSDQEIDELVAYLSTLKDPSVQTPKPIKK
ncbi:MAG: c-type cytochrome [Nitrospirae bacterium]|nr:MAG: c-type cytochrome [Nitrospirota bacterium]